MAVKDVKCKLCPAMVFRDAVTGLCAECLRMTQHNARPEVQLAADRNAAAKTEELATLKRKYEVALKTIKRQETDLESMGLLDRDIEPFEIKPTQASGTSEGTVFWVASDWHAEERVEPGTISGLNDYNLELAKERAVQFFQGGLRLTRLLEQDIKIPTIVIPLLGDFVSNDIHEEVAESALLEPMHAITFARELITSGIQFVLDNTKQNILLPCHSGNHARTTKTTRSGHENGHSIEFLMYLHLRDWFRNEKRVQFQIAEGYHSYLPVYDKTIRFHHGHEAKYQGGVGGIYIPVNKATAQWNQARHADLDVFGHFHQLVDGGRFICNGSMIGYNAFALSIKASYEPPKQALFLMDKKRGRTCTWPILFKR